MQRALAEGRRLCAPSASDGHRFEGGRSGDDDESPVRALIARNVRDAATLLATPSSWHTSLAPPSHSCNCLITSYATNEETVQRAVSDRRPRRVVYLGGPMRVVYLVGSTAALAVSWASTLDALPSHSHDATSGAVASVPRRLRVVVPSEAEVVLAVVHNDTAAEDRAAPAQRNSAVGEVEVRDAVLARHDVAEVADVADPVVRRAVRAVERVVVPARAGAAVREDVAVRVHVEAVLAGGEAGDLV